MLLMELVNFAIPSFKRETLEKRIAKLAKKAVKYGNGDITIKFGKEFVAKYTNSEGETFSYNAVEVSVEGDAPKIDGHEFLARVEIMNGENLIHSVPGSSVKPSPEYRHHTGYCDHCNTDRYRKDVFILEKNGEQIAVGRSCLRDYLGIDDPKGIVYRAQFFEELKDISDEDIFSGGISFYSLKDVLSSSAAYIRKYGYVSKAKQQETGESTTGECVKNFLNGYPGYKIDIEETDHVWAEKTTEFFRESNDFDSDYMQNLKVLLSQDIVNPIHINIVASAVISAQRALSTKEETKTSNFVGSVKERLKGLELTITKIIYLGTGMYGPNFLHSFKDVNGNIFTWFTGTKLENAEGETIVVDATVKEHKLYNGSNQTVLTRLKQTK